ncbi:hypothetical protein Tco_0790794 [Tanacetum coccineum]
MTQCSLQSMFISGMKSLIVRGYHAKSHPRHQQKRSLERKTKTTELETISEADLTEAEQFKIITKRSHKETYSSHANGSGADEGIGVTPGVLDAPNYDSDDDIYWKSRTNVEGRKSDEEATKEDQGNEHVEETNTDLEWKEMKLKALEDNFSELRQTNQYAEALSSIPGIVDQYLANKMQEAWTLQSN